MVMISAMNSTLKNRLGICEGIAIPPHQNSDPKTCSLVERSVLGRIRRRNGPRANPAGSFPHRDVNIVLLAVQKDIAIITMDIFHEIAAACIRFAPRFAELKIQNYELKIGDLWWLICSQSQVCSCQFNVWWILLRQPTGLGNL